MKRTLFILLLLSNTVFAQKLIRKADRGFSYRTTLNQGVTITNIQEKSEAYLAGLRKDDLLTEIDKNPLNSYVAVNSVLPRLKSGKPLEINLIRNNENLTFKVTFKPAPTETYEKTIVEYGSFLSNGVPIRSLTSIPKSKPNRKLPAVMLVQWLSCGSVEIAGEPEDGFDYVIKSFAANPEVIFHRIDKNGVGDSEGQPCVSCDAVTEIQNYKDALQILKKRPDVDTTQIYLLGLSLGTSFAPIIGENQNIKGYMVSGGTTVTWFEHMLEVERRRLALSGSKPSEINQAARQFSNFYDLYLNQQKTPLQIITENPSLKSIWYDQPEHQYGRPVKYFQQIQALNFEAAWQKVKVPVIAVYGEYDWLMSFNDHQKIIEIVNQSNNQELARLVVMPKTGHLLSTFSSLQNSFSETDGKINTEPYNIFKTWLNEKLK
jgi:pimeloyl-ACP methyl ester carboxylesterase